MCSSRLESGECDGKVTAKANPLRICIALGVSCDPCGCKA